MANKSRGISQAGDPVFWEILVAAKIKLKKNNGLNIHWTNVLIVFTHSRFY
jgi:hypothetical protein